jgi:hypothetical protein
MREDDGLLREAAARGEIGAGFDRLRRTYRRRREVWGSRVEVAGPQPAQGQLLAALGCEAVEARE